MFDGQDETCWNSDQVSTFNLHALHPRARSAVVQNPTLSDTLLENPTLCGTEVGQNGTLAILAYAYCHQWEFPPLLLTPSPVLTESIKHQEIVLEFGSGLISEQTISAHIFKTLCDTRLSKIP